MKKILIIIPLLFLLFSVTDCQKENKSVLSYLSDEFHITLGQDYHTVIDYWIANGVPKDSIVLEADKHPNIELYVESDSTLTINLIENYSEDIGIVGAFMELNKSKIVSIKLLTSKERIKHCIETFNNFDYIDIPNKNIIPPSSLREYYDCIAGVVSDLTTKEMTINAIMIYPKSAKSEILESIKKREAQDKKFEEYYRNK